MLALNCPECRLRYFAQDRHVGGRIRCGRCGTIFEVLRTAAPREPARPPAEPSPPTRFLNPFALFQWSGSMLRQFNTGKAYLYGIIAMLLQAVIGFGPIGLGVWLAFRGEWSLAVLVPLVLYFIYALYSTLWPLLAVIGFISGWMAYGFLEGLLRTLIGLFVILAPGCRSRVVHVSSPQGCRRGRQVRGPLVGGIGHAWLLSRQPASL